MLTREETAKVFAIYYGCEYTHTGVTGIIDATVLTDLNDNIYGFEWFKLLLTPLSNITDEHAVQVAKIVGIIDKECPQSDYSYWGDYVKRRILKKGINDVHNSAMVTQHLISKGYAVPLFFGINHPYTGKTAFECGIAIVKQ